MDQFDRSALFGVVNYSSVKNNVSIFDAHPNEDFRFVVPRFNEPLNGNESIRGNELSTWNKRSADRLSICDKLRTIVLVHRKPINSYPATNIQSGRRVTSGFDPANLRKGFLP
jgi:hypothetical protein